MTSHGWGDSQFLKKCILLTAVLYHHWLLPPLTGRLKGVMASYTEPSGRSSLEKAETFKEILDRWLDEPFVQSLSPTNFNQSNEAGEKPPVLFFGLLSM